MSSVIEITCRCGSQFIAYQSQHRTYCSRRCHYDAIRKSHTGHQDGYVYINLPEVDETKHRRIMRRSIKLVRLPEHVYVAEIALGHALPSSAQVHHVDENRSNNASANLVICENAAYHLLIHARQRVVNAGGNPNKEKLCSTCLKLQPISDFYIGHSKCRACFKVKNRRYHQNRKAVALAQSN